MADTLIDCRYEALIDKGIAPAHINEMVLEWLQIEGATSDVLSDAWLEFLDTFPLLSGVPNTKTDRWFALLGGAGFTGTINDRELQFWCAGGIRPLPGESFIIVVRTTTPTETFTLPFNSVAPLLPMNALIDWGDGNTDTVTVFDDPVLTHTYDVADDYTIDVSGVANCLRFANAGDILKLIQVVQWGRIGWTNCEAAFHGCANCEFISGPDSDTSNVTSMANMFRQCDIGDPNVSGFDTSLVNDFRAMFFMSFTANPDVSGWVTGLVTNMNSTFDGMLAADLDVSNFDTSSVNDIKAMFRNTPLSDPDVSGWDIGLMPDFSDFMNGSGFGDANYDLALVAFAGQAHQNNVPCHFGTARFGAGAPATARAALQADGWQFIDGGPAPPTLTHDGEDLTHDGENLTHED